MHSDGLLYAVTPPEVILGSESVLLSVSNVNCTVSVTSATLGLLAPVGLDWGWDWSRLNYTLTARLTYAPFWTGSLGQEA